MFTENELRQIELEGEEEALYFLRPLIQEATEKRLNLEFFLRKLKKKLYEEKELSEDEILKICIKASNELEIIIQNRIEKLIHKRILKDKMKRAKLEHHIKQSSHTGAMGVHPMYWKKQLAKKEMENAEINIEDLPPILKQKFINKI